MSRLPRRLVATGPDRDQLVALTEVWTPADTADLARALAGHGEPARPIEEEPRG